MSATTANTANTTNTMRFGCCAQLPDADLVRAAGFDYLEPHVATVMKPEYEDDVLWEQAKSELFDLAERGLPVEAMNVFLPRHLKVTGPDASALQRELYTYVALAMYRMSENGVRVVVFGSGGARSIPAGFERTRAEDQLAAFLAHLERESAATGVAVVIEPLNLKESNIFTSVAESDQFALSRGVPGIYVLADLYHMAQEGETYDGMRAAGPRLRHAHVADVDRTPPGMGEVADYPGFFRTLREIGYAGTVSVECRWESDADDRAARGAEYAAANQYLRRAWAASGA